MDVFFAVLDPIGHWLMVASELMLKGAARLLRAIKRRVHKPSA